MRTLTLLFIGLFSTVASAVDTALPKGALHRFGSPPAAEADIKPGDGVVCVLFTANNAALFAGRADGTLLVLDVTTGKQSASIKAHDDAITSIVRRGDKALLTASKDNHIKEWNPSGKAVKSLAKLPAGVQTMAISNSGKKLAIALDGTETRLSLLDAVKGTFTQRYKGPQLMNQLAFAPDDLTLLVAGGEVLQMWNLVSNTKLWERGQELKEAVRSADSPSHSGCAFSSDKLYAAATIDAPKASYVLIWDAKTGKGHKRFAARSSRVVFALSPGSEWLAVGGDKPEVTIFKVATGQAVFEFPEPGRRVMSLAFSPDGRKLASGHVDGTVTVWEMKAAVGEDPQLFPAK